jgi:hypothetical protein
MEQINNFLSMEYHKIYHSLEMVESILMECLMDKISLTKTISIIIMIMEMRRKSM